MFLPSQRLKMHAANFITCVTNFILSFRNPGVSSCHNNTFMKIVDNFLLIHKTFLSFTAVKVQKLQVYQTCKIKK